MAKKYVHYGCDRFEPYQFRDILNKRGSNKPSGGLWASPVDSENSWRNWCEIENFHPELLCNSFEFALTEDAKVLYLNDIVREDDYAGVTIDKFFKNVIDIRDENFFIRQPNQPRAVEDLSLYLDFWSISNKLHYDAIEVAIDSAFYWLLYGWDVDSLLVLNPDCIVEQPR